MKRRNFIKFGAVAVIAPIVSSAKTTHEDKIERNKAAMKRFETAINTADEALLNELVDPEAPFVTPASKDPLYGGSGYNAIVKMMRASFPDVQWAMQDMVADERCAAVYWLCSGTHKHDFYGHRAYGAKI